MMRRAPGLYYQQSGGHYHRRDTMTVRSERERWEQTLSEALGVSDQDRAALRALRVLPLVWELGAGFVLNEKGIVLQYDGGDKLAVCADLRTANVALMSAARFVPELTSFIKRPAATTVCPCCLGSGRAPNAPVTPLESFVCFCGGLGWIPDG